MKILVSVLLCLAASVAARSTSNGRIIGGQPAYSGEFPYTVALYVTRETATTFCAGALLSAEWILTAGTCVNEIEGNSITVVLGTVKLQSNESSVVRVVSTTAVAHPDFNAETLENDIGLLQLPSAIDFTTRIRPINLPASPIADGEAGVVVGWGQVDEEVPQLSDNLNYVTLWALPDSTCKSIYPGQIVGNMVCFQGTTNEGICVGDLGSPIIQHTVNGGTVVIGVAAFVSSHGCQTTDPSGFTKVYEYLDWIRETTGIE